MVWDGRRVVNGDMGTGDEELEEYRSGHASSAFIFASTISGQVCLASGEHFRKYRMQVASTFPIAGISRRCCAPR